MQAIKAIITHVLHGLVLLAELFDKSVQGLVNELDTTESESKTKK